MVTVGIPKGLFYFEHHVLWENFFCNLGCNVKVSDDTNKEYWTGCKTLQQ